MTLFASVTRLSIVFSRVLTFLTSWVTSKSESEYLYFRAYLLFEAVFYTDFICCEFNGGDRVL